MTERKDSPRLPTPPRAQCSGDFKRQPEEPPAIGLALPQKGKGPRHRPSLNLMCTLRRPGSASRGQRVLDQFDPIRGAENDRLIVEIIGGVMQPGSIAVAAEDKSARPLFQHIGEIF